MTATPLAAPMHSMRAVSIDRERAIRVVTAARPDPGAGELRIRVEGSGLCASSLPLWEGREWFAYPQPPGAPGHEGWGVVDAAGSGASGFDVGDRVAFISGHAFAEYDLAATSAVVPIGGLPVDQPFPGEALGCAFNIFRRSEIESGQTVAIIGIGFLGAILCRLAADAGATVVAISRRRFALEMAGKFGAAITIPMDDHRAIVERVKDLTGGEGCERVIEATGQQWPLDLASELTRERGRLVIAGYHQDGPRQVNMQLWNWRGLDVINAHERDPLVYAAGVRHAVDALASGKLDPRPLYTHSFALDELGDAFATLQHRPDGFMKALVRIR